MKANTALKQRKKTMRAKKSIDIHCHILPGVDDGAEDEWQTFQMLKAAKSVGIETIIATPHLRSIKQETIFGIQGAYEKMKTLFEQQNVDILLGYECNQRLFLDHSAREIGRFGLAESDVILLEFSERGMPLQWESYIQDLQIAGKEVIIAHPERYPGVQNDISIAQRMVQIGCELQVSATFLNTHGFSSEKKCARRLFDMGLISYIASDAHSSEDYQAFERVQKKFGEKLRHASHLDSILYTTNGSMQQAALYRGK